MELLTGWPQYTMLPFRKIAATMNGPIISDGRNCLRREVGLEARFHRYTVGMAVERNCD